MRFALRLTGAALLLLLLPHSAHAAQWTAAGVTGSIAPPNLVVITDPFGSSLAPLAVWNGGGITFNDIAATESIQITYNVSSDEAQPGWTDLTMGYGGVVSGTSVVATLYKVNRSTGSQATICSITSNGIDTVRGCSFTSTAVNFENYAYYVLVVLNRNAAGKFPKINYLRLNS